jgi:hypothetical protein
LTVQDQEEEGGDGEQQEDNDSKEEDGKEGKDEGSIQGEAAKKAGVPEAELPSKSIDGTGAVNEKDQTTKDAAEASASFALASGDDAECGDLGSDDLILEVCNTNYGKLCPLWNLPSLSTAPFPPFVLGMGS